MIVALFLLIDVGLMCYLLWHVSRAPASGQDHDLGLLSYRVDEPDAEPVRPDQSRQGGRDA